MALFMVQHWHEAATCPAGDPQRGGMLLQLLASAPKAGITIRAEAVVNGAHELNIIAEGADAATVEKFMAPFGMMGSVTVRPASVCEQVVERGRC